jgi:hypothetical protein
MTAPLAWRRERHGTDQTSLQHAYCGFGGERTGTGGALGAVFGSSPRCAVTLGWSVDLSELKMRNANTATNATANIIGRPSHVAVPIDVVIRPARIAGVLISHFSSPL